MDDRELIELLGRSSDSGMAELLRRYGPLIRYVITPILKNPADIEDCFSEISLKIVDKLHSFDPEKGSLKAYLTVLSRNTALNLLRRSKNSGSDTALSDSTPDLSPSPEESLLRRELYEAVRRSISLLSERDRSLFYRKYYYMQSTAQIARETGLSERAVEGRLYRLKKRLRSKLGGEGYE